MLRFALEMSAIRGEFNIRGLNDATLEPVARVNEWGGGGLLYPRQWKGKLKQNSSALMMLDRALCAFCLFVIHLFSRQDGKRLGSGSSIMHVTTLTPSATVFYLNKTPITAQAVQVAPFRYQGSQRHAGSSSLVVDCLATRGATAKSGCSGHSGFFPWLSAVEEVGTYYSTEGTLG